MKTRKFSFQVGCRANARKCNVAFPVTHHLVTLYTSKSKKFLKTSFMETVKYWFKQKLNVFLAAMGLKELKLIIGYTRANKIWSISSKRQTYWLLCSCCWNILVKNIGRLLSWVRHLVLAGTKTQIPPRQIKKCLDTFHNIVINIGKPNMEGSSSLGQFLSVTLIRTECSSERGFRST